MSMRFSGAPRGPVGLWALLFTLMFVGTPQGVLAFDSRLVLDEADGETTSFAWAVESNAFVLETSQTSDGSGTTSPFLAGLMSALVPGLGQLKQGDARGWAYLGLDIASWFAWASFNASGDQGLTDSRKTADTHWSMERYFATPQGCEDSQGNIVGPVDIDEESAQLQRNYESNRGRYYDDLGRNPYACGWGDMLIRDQYRQSRSDAQSFYTKADWTIALMVVNRLVSAVDAGRSAAKKRKAGGLDLQSRWRGSAPELTLAYRIGF